MPKVEYRIYVVELSKRVFTENTKFRAANPQFECLTSFFTYAIYGLVS